MALEDLLTRQMPHSLEGEQAAAVAGLGRQLHGAVLQLLGSGDGLLPLALLLGLAGLLLQVHGVDGVRRGQNGQLSGQQIVPGIALRRLNELALLALAPDVLL